MATTALANTGAAPPTLVSAYYRIPSKQPHAFYVEHLRRFFRMFRDQRLVFFCDAAMRAELDTICGDVSWVTFIIQEFADLPILRKIPRAFWNATRKLDSEAYHTPELGILWASKKEFLRQAAATITTTASDWFLWVDAGCIRTEDWEVDCKNFGTRRLYTMEPGVYLQCIQPIPAEKRHFRYPDVHIAGAIILAHRKYIDDFCKQYDDMVFEYIEKRIPFLMDQYVLASMVQRPDTPAWLRTISSAEELSEIDRLYCVDIWFFFLMWL